jgi:enediyne biosynthesis protein E4
MKHLQTTILMIALTGEFFAGALGTAQETGKTGAGSTQDQPVPTVPRGGSATAGVFAAVKDSELRPITAGGFVNDGPVIFKDVAKQAGLTGWHHVMGTLEKKYILEAPGSGVALLDYDNDGWLDIYLVNGSTYDALKGTAEPPHA